MHVGWRTEVDVPDGRGGCRIVGVEGVDAVVDGGDDDEVVGASVDLHAGGEQRLGVELVVERALEDHAELRFVDRLQR